MGPLCALYVLERLLHVMTHSRFVNLLASTLLLSGPGDSCAAPSLHGAGPGSRRSMDGGDASIMVRIWLAPNPDVLSLCQ